MMNIIEKILATGKITKLDQIYLNYHLLSQIDIGNQENRIIKKLFDNIQMGFIQVVD